MRALALALGVVLFAGGLAGAQTGASGGGAPVDGAVARAGDGRTEVERSRAFVAWQTARLVENFKTRNPQASPEVVEHVRKYVEGALTVVDRTDPEAPTLVEMDELLAPLKEATSDPVVKVVRTLIWYEKGLTEYIVKYPVTAEKMTAAKIPGDLVAAVCGASSWCQQAAGDNKGFMASMRGLNQGIASALEGEWTVEEQRWIVRQLRWITDRELVPAETVESLAVMTEEGPGKNAWLREMVLGDLRYQAAWRYRGHESGAEVTREGWKGFREQLIPAEEHFRKAYELRPEAPEAAEKMVSIERCRETGHDAEASRLWYDRSIKAQFDNPRARRSYLYSRQARWHGSDEEMFAFADECVATKRYDTSAPGVYIEAFDYYMSRVPEEHQIEERAKYFDRLREVLMGYVRASKGERTRQGWLSRLVHDGWLAGKYAEVGPALDELGAAGLKVEPGRTSSQAATIAMEVRAFGSKAGMPLIGARAEARAGRWNGVLRAVKLALDGSKDEAEPVKHAIRQIALPLQARAELETGLATGPAFEEGLAGWEEHGGAKVLDGASVEISDNWMVGLAGYGRKYVIEAEVDVSATKAGGEAEASVAIVGVTTQPYSLLSMVLKRAAAGDEVMLVTKSSRVSRGLDELKVEAGKPAKFRIEVWGSYAIVSVNGELVYRGRAGEENERGFEGDRLGLYSKGKSVFKNVSVKKVEKRPEGVDEMYDPGEGK